MKRKITAIFITLIALLMLCLSACGKVEFKVNFVVDGEIYATVDTNGNEDVTQYFLRHTFSSTCKRFVTKSEVVDLWMGDSPEKLVDRVYTHYPDDFMQEQMQLVQFFA